MIAQQETQTKAAITLVRKHGPGAVRVLIYRLCDRRERAQLPVPKSTWTGLPPASSKKICDLPCDPRARRSRRRPRFEYDSWSGGGDAI